MNRVVAKRTFRFQHVDSGEHCDVTVLSEAADSLDRASHKLNTMAKKTAVREMFFLEVGDDEYETVAQRGAPNEDLFRRARQAIRGQQSQEDAQAKLDAVLASKRCDWTPEQEDALRRAAQQWT